MCDNVCNREVSSVFCEIRCFTFFSILKKKNDIKLDHNESSNNEGEDPVKTRPGLGERSFLCK